MKKFSIKIKFFCILITIILILAGCGNSENQSNEDDNKEDLIKINFVRDYAEGKENKVGNTANNIQTSHYDGGYLAKQDSWIYYSMNTPKLYKMQSNGTKENNNISILFNADEKEEYSGNISNINVIGDYIYFIINNKEVAKDATRYDFSICKIRTDGYDFSELDRVESSVLKRMYVFEDGIYYQTTVEKNENVRNYVIAKMSLNGDNKEYITDENSNFMLLFVDSINKNIYAKESDTLYGSDPIKYIDNAKKVHKLSKLTDVKPSRTENNVLFTDSGVYYVVESILNYKPYNSGNATILVDILNNENGNLRSTLNIAEGEVSAKITQIAVINDNLLKVSYMWSSNNDAGNGEFLINTKKMQYIILGNENESFYYRGLTDGTYYYYVKSSNLIPTVSKRSDLSTSKPEKIDWMVNLQVAD